MTSFTSQPTTTTIVNHTSTLEILLARLSRRISLLENLDTLDQDVFFLTVYKETAKTTIPLLSDCFQLLEQEHVLDITEEDWERQLDDILQSKIEQQQEWNQKWKQWEELVTMTNHNMQRSDDMPF
ncbi:hypothetical protein Gasu2_67920 [Galdieria sulphuraria]|uniref:Uncharacterized protein n=1 Tax=Galdieria sulphuraria TaxID=130081 RepID=M2XZS3_GALSU|nr:uncharacterized protein Gasu_34710 [Galdieria sulphuraria]EME29079.1 hypothetical protein Gasu_34710 [Galdieria sulphuraria]GJD12718.1 hypothetical protein Gasu2_67920 [Galdieria sulphuraria]|eukprot:XP_005705599.1 hypothetical protein Gasu_34710 [Galdieria sulphuraria]